MSIQVLGMKAYTDALEKFNKAEKAFQAGGIASPDAKGEDFARILTSSLAKVNALQEQKKADIISFASGENQNVHELMISLQKAGLAMNMTAAVRNKVMEAYKELARMQF